MNKDIKTLPNFGILNDETEVVMYINPNDRIKEMSSIRIYNDEEVTKMLDMLITDIKVLKRQLSCIGYQLDKILKK